MQAGKEARCARAGLACCQLCGAAESPVQSLLLCRGRPRAGGLRHWRGRRVQRHAGAAASTARLRGRAGRLAAEGLHLVGCFCQLVCCGDTGPAAEQGRGMQPSNLTGGRHRCRRVAGARAQVQGRAWWPPCTKEGGGASTRVQHRGGACLRWAGSGVLSVRRGIARLAAEIVAQCTAALKAPAPFSFSSWPARGCLPWVCSVKRRLTLPAAEGADWHRAGLFLCTRVPRTAWARMCLVQAP